MEKNLLMTTFCQHIPSAPIRFSIQGSETTTLTLKLQKSICPVSLPSLHHLLLTLNEQ